MPPSDALERWHSSPPYGGSTSTQAVWCCEDIGPRCRGGTRARNDHGGSHYENLESLMQSGRAEESSVVQLRTTGEGEHFRETTRQAL
jgi:hypothetical protein